MHFWRKIKQKFFGTPLWDDGSSLFRGKFLKKKSYGPAHDAGAETATDEKFSGFSASATGMCLLEIC